jgi:hypothetical protein
MNKLSNTIPILEEELKKILTDFQNGEGVLEDMDHSLLIRSMMHHIGSIDPELRDQLIYRTFSQLILENKLGKEILTELLEISLSDSFLFKGIGEGESDTVFTRSFTSLLIALILYMDNKESFLPQSEISMVHEALIRYLRLENDVRGYVPEKGWAHSIAHVSDAVDELVLNKKCNNHYYSEILRVLWSKLFISTSVYLHDEEERVINPIMAMIENGLRIEEVITVIENIPSELQIQKVKTDFEGYLFLVRNCKTFLKSLYIKMVGHEHLLSVQESILKTLKQVR